MKKITSFSLGLFAAFISSISPLWANEPKPNSLGFQPPASPQAERLIEFHDGLLMYIITAIVIFVLALLVWVVLRYNAKANPEPSKTTHNVLLEIIWTGVPVLILIIIAIPSFKLLYYLDRTDAPDMTLKVVGYQWNWGYAYPDHGVEEFIANMIPDEDINEERGERRLLSTDYKVVLPIDTNIQFDITAGDVIHAFTVPAFGIKKDAVPGRLNNTWVRIDKPGTYYGQCSEICGINHAFMPIEVEAVSKEDFERWVKVAKEDIDKANEMVLAGEFSQKTKIAQVRGQ